MVKKIEDLNAPNTIQEATIDPEVANTYEKMMDRFNKTIDGSSSHAPNMQEANKESKELIEKIALKKGEKKVAGFYPNAFYIIAEMNNNVTTRAFRRGIYGPFYDPEETREHIVPLIRDRYSEEILDNPDKGLSISLHAEKGETLIRWKEDGAKVISLTLQGHEEREEVKKILEQFEGITRTQQEVLLQELARKFGKQFLNIFNTRYDK